jgi:predicted permease
MLFVDIPGIHVHPAPDGLPPLEVILDTATFIGAASVPLGLVCLGSALSRMKVPLNHLGTLPLGAITCLTIGKMLVMPVIGVLLSKGLVKANLIHREDKVLRFVCM